MNNANRRRARAGFTLIEILVVLAIIGILMSLSMAAYQRVRIQRAIHSTEDVVLKLQTAVDTQVKIIADNVMQERLKGSADFNALLTFCDGDADRTQALLTYCRLKQAFPNAAEIASNGFTMNGVAFPLPPAFKPLTGISDTPENVSAVVLMLALSQRTQGGNTFASDEATSGAQMDFKLPSGPTVRVYRDAFSNPIAFQRFWMSPELDAPPYAKSGAAARDPFDALGKLGNWTNATNKNTAQTAIGNCPSESGLIPPFNNRNKSIVVYSFGLDKVPDSPLGNVDDILGYRLRMVGGKGAKP